MSAGRARAGGRMVAAALALLLGSALAGGAGAPSGGAAAPGAPTVGPAAEPADTARVRLEPPPGWPLPLRLAVEPDSVLFGGEVEVVLGFPPGTPRPAAGELDPGAPQLAWTGGSRWRAGAAAGPELRLRARLLARGVLVLAWADGPEATCRTGSRLADGRGPAPLRPLPRLGTWRPWPALALAAAALLGFMAVAAARGRRRRAADDRPLPEPAHLIAALALVDLLRSGLLQGGRGRAFLDRFCGIVGDFLALRYGVASRQLAAAELSGALLARGHGSAAASALADLLAEGELLRYAPAAPAASACRELLDRAVRLIAEVRVEPLFSPVRPDLLREGRRAWFELVDGAAAAGVLPATAEPAGATGEAV